jgi:hypothetical protein
MDIVSSIVYILCPSLRTENLDLLSSYLKCILCSLNLSFCSSYIKFVAAGACQFINPLPVIFVERLVLLCLRLYYSVCYLFCIE